MIAPWARSFVGIPFAKKGSSRAGCSCWGLLVLVYREAFDIALPDYEDEYTGAESLGEIAALMDRERQGQDWTLVQVGVEPRARLRAGDGVLIPYRGSPCHVGVYAGDGAMLHVFEGHTAVVDDLARPELAARARRARVFRHGEMAA